MHFPLKLEIPISKCYPIWLKNAVFFEPDLRALYDELLCFRNSIWVLFWITISISLKTFDSSILKRRFSISLLSDRSLIYVIAYISVTYSCNVYHDLKIWFWWQMKISTKYSQHSTTTFTITLYCNKKLVYCNEKCFLWGSPTVI